MLMSPVTGYWTSPYSPEISLWPVLPPLSLPGTSQQTAKTLKRENKLISEMNVERRVELCVCGVCCKTLDRCCSEAKPSPKTVFARLSAHWPNFCDVLVKFMLGVIVLLMMTWKKQHIEILMHTNINLKTQLHWVYFIIQPPCFSVERPEHHHQLRGPSSAGWRSEWVWLQVLKKPSLTFSTHNHQHRPHLRSVKMCAQEKKIRKAKGQDLKTRAACWAVKTSSLRSLIYLWSSAESPRVSNTDLLLWRLCSWSRLIDCVSQPNEHH